MLAIQLHKNMPLRGYAREENELAIVLIGSMFEGLITAVRHNCEWPKRKKVNNKYLYDSTAYSNVVEKS